ncbi:MAG: hypothetical protein ACRDOI_36795 [Trebonia sp.]
MVMQPGPASDAAYPAVRLTPIQPRDERRDGERDQPRERRRPVVAVILVLSLCGLGFATRGALTQVMPRRFTVAQQRQILSWEVSRRWRTLPEATIFPDFVSYQLPSVVLDGGDSLALTARRLGVAAPAGCAQGAHPAAARILAGYGCTTVLRATYADSTGSMLVTVGVAVLPGIPAAIAAGNQLANMAQDDPARSVSPAAVPGTLADGFSAGQQQLSWDTHAGSYVIMATAGYADGRPPEHVKADSYLFAEMNNLEQGISDTVSGVLGKPVPPPACPGVPGC